MSHFPHLEREVNLLNQARINALARIDLTRLGLVRAVPTLQPLHDAATAAQTGFITGKTDMPTLQAHQQALLDATLQHFAVDPVFEERVKELQDLEDAITNWMED